MTMKEQSLNQFTEDLASKAPVPGGGGASALVGAVAAALGEMVASLTIGKKKYADVEEEMQLARTRADELRVKLLQLIQEDADAFAPLAAAYRMPTETEEQQAAKAEVMEDCLRRACEVPLEIMRAICEVTKLMEFFAQNGSKLAISDAGVGAVFCRAALEGASLNVFINTASMKDRAYAEAIEAEANEMLDIYTFEAEDLFQRVRESL